MNRLKGIFHTVRFMWVGRFGGSIFGGNYYLLKSIMVYSNVQFSCLTVHKLHNGSAFTLGCSEVNKITLNHVTLKNKGCNNE